MIDITQDSVIFDYSTAEKRDFFELVLDQIRQTKLMVSSTENNMRGMAGSLHKMKGTFSYFIDIEILEMIKSLEIRAKSNSFTNEDLQNFNTLLNLIQEEIVNFISRLD